MHLFELNNQKRIVYVTGLCFLYLLLIINTSAIDYIVKLGRHIPVTSIGLQTDYVYGVLWAWLLACTINVWPVSERDKSCLSILWLIKIVVTLVFMLAYEYIYKIDAFGYFIKPLEHEFIFDGFSIYNGTGNVFSFAWLHHQLLPVESFHFFKVTFSMIGLLAAYNFYRAFSNITGNNSAYILFVFCLFPSLLFFSSTIGKEPLMLLGISMYVNGVTGLIVCQKNRIISFLIFLAGVGVVILTRYWMGLIVLLPLFVFLYHMPVSNKVKIIITTLMALMLINISIPIVHKIDTIGVMYFDQLSKNLAIGGSANVWGKSFDDVYDLILFFPVGAFAALFRPLPGEVLSAFGIMSGLENIILISAVAYILIKLDKTIIKSSIFQWLVLIVVFWLSIYSFVSYFNFGTAVRYKVQILPIILMLFFYVSHSRSVVSD